MIFISDFIFIAQSQSTIYGVIMKAKVLLLGIFTDVLLLENYSLQFNLHVFRFYTLLTFQRKKFSQ